MPYSPKSNGFTLIEVMIVVAIIAILAAIAIPSYQDSVLETNRAEGKAFLLSIAQAQERHFTQWGQYANNLAGPVGPNNLGVGAAPVRSENQRYTVTLAGTPTTFILTATPTIADPICGNLTLTNAGVRGSTINNGNQALCW